MRSETEAPSGLPAPGYSARYLQEVRATGGILVSPVATLRRFGNRRPIVNIWIGISIATVLLAISTVSLSQRAAAHILQDSGSSLRAEAVQQDLARLKITAIALAPAGLAAQWAGIAIAMWTVGVLAGVDTTYRTYLSIVAVTCGPAILGRTVDLAVAWHVGPEFRPDLTPALSSATSLAALFPAGTGNAWGLALLDQITPFTIWTLGLWGVALRQWGRMPKAKAGTVAAVPWTAIRLGTAAAQVVQGAFVTALGPPPPSS